MTDTPWHVAKADAETPEPPLSDADLRDRLRAGTINDDDLIWRDGLSTWLEARHFTWLLEKPGGPKGS